MLSMAGIRKYRGHARSKRTFELRVPDLSILPGQAYGICGESGSGKSTLLAIIALAMRPDEATVFSISRGARTIDVMGAWRSNRADPTAQFRRESLGYVLQQGGLFGALSVRENIALSGRIRGYVDRVWMRELIERLGIGDVLSRKPRQISIGQRQRTAIARALLNKPDLIIADEPTASVDPLNGDRIFSLLLDLVADSGASVVIASHDVERLKRPEIELYRHCLTDDDGVTVSTLKAAA